MQKCHISWYFPAEYRKIAHFHFLYSAEFIKGMDEDTRMSWIAGDMLSPHDPSFDAILLTGERTYTTFAFMRLIYHLTI